MLVKLKHIWYIGGGSQAEDVLQRQVHVGLRREGGDSRQDPPAQREVEGCHTRA